MEEPRTQSTDLHEGSTTYPLSAENVRLVVLAKHYQVALCPLSFPFANSQAASYEVGQGRAISAEQKSFSQPSQEQN